MRNLKVLGLALAAMFAITAVFSSAALADFNSESSPTTLTVSSNNMQSFKVKASSGLTVECTTVSLDNSTVTGTTVETITVEPTYSSCEEFLEKPVDIDENGCHYLFHLSDSSTTGSVDVDCPSTSGIEITVGNICKYKISDQTGLSHIVYSNSGTSSTREVTLEPNVTSITSTRTTSDFPFLCPNGSSEGTYTGNSTVTGENSGSHVGIFVD